MSDSLREEIRKALETREYQETRFKEFLSDFEEVVRRIQRWLKKLEELELLEQNAETSQVFYKKAVDLVYERSLGELEETINAALRYIFFDRTYAIRFSLGDSHGKSLELLLVDDSEGKNRVIDMKDGVGNGVRSVVSYVLLVLYLTSRNIPPILFADEAYSAISESYVDRFFTFVKGLATSKQAPLVLISHDDRFLPYADQRIRVQDGKVSVL